MPVVEQSGRPKNLHHYDEVSTLRSTVSEIFSGLTHVKGNRNRTSETLCKNG